MAVIHTRTMKYNSGLLQHAARYHACMHLNKFPEWEFHRHLWKVQLKSYKYLMLNDLYRTLLGVKRTDHIRVSELADRAGCPTLNQLVAKQAAVCAWRSQNGGPLDDILEPFDDRTRGSSLEKRKPASARCIASNNLAKVWNASKELREASTLSKAKLAAKKFSESVRHF